MAFMFSMHWRYQEYDHNNTDASSGIYLFFEDALEQLKLETQKSIDLRGFPKECYEDGYGVDFYPEDDEVCAGLEHKMINALWPEEKDKYYQLLNEEIEKHRIKDFNSLIKHLSSFGEPPTDFYGLVEVDIMD